MNYYNENDLYAAEWLRNLIKAGLIPDGHVDTRSIADVQPADLKDFTQCHFFAGIAGWPLALALAGWPEDRPVWTGSCPCQPFSVAGKNKGVNDERHLWPVFRNLIAERKPPTVFGEQVASRAGREWLCGVRANLETLGYAVGAADLCAAGVGAPHIRQRLFWVGDTLKPGLEGLAGDGDDRDQPGRDSAQPGGPITAPGRFGGLEDTTSKRLEGGATTGDQIRTQGGGLLPAGSSADAGGLGNSTGEQVGDAGQPRRQSNAPGFWDAFDVVPCADGKARRIESGTFPLAHGVPGRVGKLRAYGNAIVPQVAAGFIEAFLEAVS